MAAQTFDEVYGQLSADEKKLLDNTFAKHPELKGGWLRQDEFSKKLNEFKTKETEFERVKSQQEKWQEWADNTIPKWDALVEKGYIDEETGEEVVTTKLSDLQKQLDEAKNSLGGDMDEAELDRRVKAIVKDAGVKLTKEEIAGLIASEGRKLSQETFDTNWAKKEEDFNSKTIPFVAGFAAANAIAADKYRRETGKDWTAETQKEFYALMGEKKNFDPYAVIDDFVAPIKKSKEVEDKDRRIAELEEKLKNRPEGGEESYIPQPDQVGALQQMLNESAADGDFESKIRAQVVKSAQELIAAK